MHHIVVLAKGCSLNSLWQGFIAGFSRVCEEPWAAGGAAAGGGETDREIHPAFPEISLKERVLMSFRCHLFLFT